MFKKIIERIAFFSLLIVIMAGGIVKADASPKILFGMSCEVTRIPVSGTPEKISFDPSQYTEELATLTKKGYNRIDSIKEFIYGDQTIKILLGEKCNLPVLRINQEESVNDLGVDHIEKRGNKLLMYGAKNGYATLITCDLGTLEKNDYKPFDLPKENSNSTGENALSQTETSIDQGSLFPLKSGKKLFIEKKSMHPQDAFVLKQQPVSEIIKIFGGDWMRDRKELADRLHIMQYKGTKTQNIQIRNYLLSYITIQLQPIKTPVIELSPLMYETAQSKVVSELVKLREYTRKYDRWALFQEIGGNISSYKGTRTQNMDIRRTLLQLITKT